jgi:uncharacterized membrane protein YqiK
MDLGMLGSGTNVFILIGVILFALITIGIILARLYTRASKEISFVRTGMGGQKVIKDGGSVVFPVLHEIIPVNMNTLRLAVHRANEQALITRDRMRVDVVAEFYVRVQPTDDAIANAAQTLGNKTMQPEKLKDLVEGKFVDALRSVAAEMSMEDLHEQRVDFVQKVQQVVSEDLLKNGLELETVSLTGLDQTGMEFFNPNNAFDAEGLTRLTEEIEQRKKIRNDIEQDTAVQIRNKNLHAAKETLEIDREEEYAKLAQEREVEIRRASQIAEIAKEQADKEREAEQAKIIANQQVQTSSITSERAIEEERIEKEKLIKERDIAKERAVETQDIERRKAVELAEQERDIAISMKSKEQSEAAAEADQARAIAVQAEEKVSTARETEVADRQKQIELIEAAKEAEREAIAIKIAAEAEKLAAIDSADAVRERARGEADEVRITAEAEAEAEKMSAAAAEIRYAVEATGNQALNEAANLLSSEQISMKVKLELIENLESIIRESAKPMENIDDIKIIQLDGLNGATAAAGAGGEVSGASVGGDNLADKVVSSALKYRAQAPLVDSLLAEVGLKSDDLNGFTKPFNGDAGDTKTDD